MTECDEHLTEVRNDYLLALAAVNAHHRHYLSHDLPHILEVNGSHTHKWLTLFNLVKKCQITVTTTFCVEFSLQDTFSPFYCVGTMVEFVLPELQLKTQ